MYSYWLHLELYFYKFQQSINHLLYFNLNANSFIILMVLYISGVLTSINPCATSMLPICLAYVDSQYEKKFNNRSFFCGLCSSLILFIFCLSIVKIKYYHLFVQLSLFVSIVPIVLGLNLLQVFGNGIDLIYIRLPKFLNLSSYSQDYIVGLSLGLNTVTCSTPVLLTLFLWLPYVNSFAITFIYVFVYLLGCLFPLFFLASLGIQYIQIYKVTQYWNFILPASACLILSSGVLRFLENILL
uniref:Cytochrome c biogenesis protein transmembrane region n=1 Tax=Renouxia sp. TaxID=2485823 RepID=A0A3G3MHR3_9FLOR|nr:cytochrome c biogenesis protein transmembrane region [Renouxia sp.]